MAEFEDIKIKLDEQCHAWEEFTKKNDELLKAKAEGKAVADLTGEVATLKEALSGFDKEIIELTKKANRPSTGDNELSEAQLEHKKAFHRFLRKGDDTGLLEIQTKALNFGSDPDGGYFVLPEMDRTIDRLAPTISAMARLANTVTIGTAKYEKMVKTSGMASRWVAEGATGGETTEPKWGKMAIEVFEEEVEPWVTNALLEDSFINLESDLAMEAAIGFSEGEAISYITGTGVGQPRGILSYTNVANASYAWGKVGYMVSGKSAAFASVAPADKIISFQHALKQQYRSGAVWLMNDATLGQARQLKDGSGQYYLWNPDPAAGFGGRFLGNPVEIDDNMPDMAAGSYSMAFGNMSRAYTIVKRSGISLIRDNITAKGNTKFNFRKRIGGGITHFEAIKLLKFATS